MFIPVSEKEAAMERASGRAGCLRLSRSRILCSSLGDSVQHFMISFHISIHMSFWSWHYSRLCVSLQFHYSWSLLFSFSLWIFSFSLNIHLKCIFYCISFLKKNIDYSIFSFFFSQYKCNQLFPFLTSENKMCKLYIWNRELQSSVSCEMVIVHISLYPPYHFIYIIAKSRYVKVHGGCPDLAAPGNNNC